MIYCFEFLLLDFDIYLSFGALVARIFKFIG